MTSQQSDTGFAQAVLESWSRVRSSDELQAFIGRRELAVATITIDEK